LLQFRCNWKVPKYRVGLTERTAIDPQLVLAFPIALLASRINPLTDMKKLRGLRPVTDVEVASAEKPLFEPRLWGTWKSDRKRTFEHACLPKATPEGLRKFRLIFGRLVVRWNKTTSSSYFDGKRFMGFPNDPTPDVQEYTVLARDPGRVVVLLGRRLPGPKAPRDPIAAEVFQELDRSSSLKTIEFDGDDGYRISVGTFFEYFRRIG